jgi:hypothetical protein
VFLPLKFKRLWLAFKPLGISLVNKGVSVVVGRLADGNPI